MILKLTIEIIKKRLNLLNKNLIIPNEYINCETRIKATCIDHNYEWNTRISKILKTKHCCPFKAGVPEINNEVIDKRLIGRNI